jgi:hypothetical protein
LILWNIRVCCQYSHPTRPASTRTIDPRRAIDAYSKSIYLFVRGVAPSLNAVFSCVQINDRF